MAGESSPVVPGRLRDLLCGPFSKGNTTRSQSELLGALDLLQVLKWKLDGSLTNSERVLHVSLYCLTFVSGNIVFLGFAFGGVSGLSIGRSSTALGFALAGGLLAGKVDSLLGKRPRNIWLAAAFAIETLLLLSAMTVSWYFVSRGG